MKLASEKQGFEGYVSSWKKQFLRLLHVPPEVLKS